MTNRFEKDPISALDAISEAQRIAFAPIVFQVARTLRETGILAALDSTGEVGATAEKVASDLELSVYGVKVLLEGGMSSGIVNASDNDRFRISKVGHFLLHDAMTRINMDFNHHLCYQAMFHLKQAILDGKPAGLATLGGTSDTIYPVVPHLPEEIRSSWYAFDHFYSDVAYPSALDVIASKRLETLVDIGANQGRFSLLAATRYNTLRITMIDLPDALAEAEAALAEAGFADRVSGIAGDVRNADAEFPENQDAYWLSQFICCFSEPEIESILSRIGSRMAPGVEALHSRDLLGSAKIRGSRIFAHQYLAVFFMHSKRKF